VRVAGKLGQAIEAVVALVRKPANFPAAIRLSDAMASSSVVQRLYRRMLDGLSPAEIAHLEELTSRPTDLAALRRLPEVTFGHQFARFIEHHGLDLGAYTAAFPPYAETLEAHWLLRRFAKVHDMHHFLLGFPVDFLSEMGLQAFNLRNFREPHSLLSLAAVPLVIAKYGEAGRTLRGLQRGWRLGGQARNLFQAPLEDLLEVDADEVRRRLGLTERPEMPWRQEHA
jgi:ubiquinone biosynthesis protein COQ4